MMNNVQLCDLESDRLYYRIMRKEFATQEYINWLNDPEVNKYLEVNKENKIEELNNYLETAINNQIFFWAIFIKNSGKHIGNIKIDPINKKHGTGEYGIMMGDKLEWGKGYAKEASQAIIRFCFEEMNLRKMTLGVVENNEPAVNLYKKLGFITEGVYKNHSIYDGVYCNIIRMAIFNPSYRYEKKTNN